MYFYKVDSNILFSKNKLNGMVEIVPNTVEASKEKHIPVVNIKENTVEVTVGSVIHPMEEKHYIEFIVLETNKGVYQQFLMPNDEPKAHFEIQNENVIGVYEYCNIHGLWAKKF